MEPGIGEMIAMNIKLTKRKCSNPQQVNTCYRLRPTNGYTLDELKNGYLWFSLRSGFKDVNDANVGAFIKDTPQILRGLELIYTEEGVKEFVRLMDNTGICCFTKSFPKKETLFYFPNGKRSLCLEYDRQKLEDYFVNSKYAIAAPFKDIVYCKHPTKMKTNGDYHILTYKDKNGCMYESVYTLFGDPKKIDYLLHLLLTRLDVKFWKQYESRIIIGGRNQKYLKDGDNGYKIEIPMDAISQVYLYEKPTDAFLKELYNIPHIKNKIKILYKQK